jgi:hypothetical protein
MADMPLLPPTLIYGSEMPDVRFRSRGGQHTFFCRRNRNLHLAQSDLSDGTYEAGSLFGDLCREVCLPPRRHSHQPCPAFVTEHMVGKENKGLASVEPRKFAKWDECAGVRALLDMTETPEERFFLECYIDDKGGDSSEWRQDLIRGWNARWNEVPEGWADTSRRGKFDHMMWQTLRFPALIPQVWLNWLHSASDEDLKILEEYPSRVDFVAFWNNERHLIEIDGPSHYAAYDESTHTYAVDEHAYARNLKIARSLQRDQWELTRIARIEIRDVMESDSAWVELEAYRFLQVLPFHHHRCTRVSPQALGVPEIDCYEYVASGDDIPF